MKKPAILKNRRALDKAFTSYQLIMPDPIGRSVDS